MIELAAEPGSTASTGAETVVLETMLVIYDYPKRASMGFVKWLIGNFYYEQLTVMGIIYIYICVCIDWLD